MPKPTSAINFDSMKFAIHGFSLGTKTIVITNANNHFEKDKRLPEMGQIREKQKRQQEILRQVMKE